MFGKPGKRSNNRPVAMFMHLPQTVNIQYYYTIRNKQNSNELNLIFIFKVASTVGLLEVKVVPDIRPIKRRLNNSQTIQLKYLHNFDTFCHFFEIICFFLRLFFFVLFQTHDICFTKVKIDSNRYT